MQYVWRIRFYFSGSEVVLHIHGTVRNKNKANKKSGSSNLVLTSKDVFDKYESPLHNSKYIILGYSSSSVYNYIFHLFQYNSTWKEGAV